ncbi:MAG: alpha/beta fold hydrolase [Gemmatimonadales bacterium]|nr:alpha/beta fold hydrolase [Gemmatimonadales bacterium]
MNTTPSSGPSAGYRALLAALAIGAPLGTPLAAQSVAGTTSAGVFYEASGTGDALVFIHAFSLDRRMWEPQVAAFDDRFRVIRFDLRGHGKSVPPGTPYTGYDDLRAVLDTLGVRRATLVGLSAGAELAINFAIAYPDRTAGIVLAAPGLGGYQTPPLPWASPVFEAAAAGDPARAARLWAETPIMALHANPSAATAVTALVMENARLWTYRRTEQPLVPSARERLGEITSPVLVIVGETDLPHIKEIARLLKDGVAGTTVVTVPKAGHLVNLDAPDLFNRTVAAFLERR